MSSSEADIAGSVGSSAPEELSKRLRRRSLFWLVPAGAVLVGVLVWGMFTVQPAAQSSGAGRGPAVAYPVKPPRTTPATDTPDGTPSSKATPDLGGSAGAGAQTGTQSSGGQADGRQPGSENATGSADDGVAGVVSGLRKGVGSGDLTRSACLNQVAVNAASRLLKSGGKSYDPGSDTSGCGAAVTVGYVVGGDPAGVEQAQAMGVRDNTGSSVLGNTRTKYYGYTVTKSDLPGMQGYILAWATAQ